MINRTVLVGRLTRDPELKRTANGAAVASFTLAVNRQFTNSQGEREADFIGCTIWRKAAENFAKFAHKGSLVGIDGRIQTSSYDNQQGQRIYRTDVIAENFSMLESRKDADNYQDDLSHSSNHNDKRADNVQKPKENQKKPSDPFADNSKPVDISDDDLPF